MMYIWQSRLATTCNFLFFGESRWKIALRCITPGWWARMQFRFIANYKLSWLSIKVKVLWKQSDTIRIIFGDIKFSLSSTWDLWDQTREMKYIVAKVLWPQSWKMSKQSWWRKEAQFPLHTGQTPPAVQNQSKSVRNILGLDKFKCAVDSLERFTFTFINWPFSRRWNVEMLLNEWLGGSATVDSVRR